MTPEEEAGIRAAVGGRSITFHCKGPPPSASHDDVAEEYAVVSVPTGCPQNIVIYGKYDGRWAANASARGLVNVLMARVKELEGERKLMAQLAKCQDEPQFTNPLIAMFAKNLRDKILSE